MQDSIEPESTTVAKNLASSLGYIGAAGFGVLVGIIAILTQSNFDQPAIILVIGLYLATLFGICFSILRMIPKVAEKQDSSAGFTNQSSRPDQLNAPNTNRLEEPKQAPASVVENTTRTLDKVPVERK